MAIINDALSNLGGFLSSFNNGPRPVDKKYTATDVQSFSYYSGSQISIWFGDIWVDDINYISYQYNQEKRPIYGYASQYFDAVAKGQILIQGNFAINFREKGYLSYIINNLPKLETSLKSSIPNSDFEKRYPEIKKLISTHLRNGTFGPKTYTEISQLAEKSDFWEQADIYEKVIWGETIEVSDREKFKYIESPDVLQQRLFPNGFNIMITYGDISSSDSNTINSMTTSTTKSLNGVHLLGSSQMMRITGEPVQEIYSFMAKGMDNYVGTTF